MHIYLIELWKQYCYLDKNCCGLQQIHVW